jgi:AcrR family transcriptional regulator
MRMVPHTYDEHGRRVVAPTKGEKREQAILDAAESQLVEIGADAMTVNTIATAAGITRGALYFYFRSKDDVIAALVRQTVAEHHEAIDLLPGGEDETPPDLIRLLIDRTRRMWKEHGAVMRAMIELAPTVESVREAWASAVDDAAGTAARIAERAGLPATTESNGSAAITRALVQMAGRAFYESSREGTSLEKTAETLTTIWLRALLLADQ